MRVTFHYFFFLFLFFYGCVNCYLSWREKLWLYEIKSELLTFYHNCIKDLSKRSQSRNCSLYLFLNINDSLKFDYSNNIQSTLRDKSRRGNILFRFEERELVSFNVKSESG